MISTRRARKIRSPRDRIYGFRKSLATVVVVLSCTNLYLLANAVSRVAKTPCRYPEIYETFLFRQKHTIGLCRKFMEKFAIYWCATVLENYGLLCCAREFQNFTTAGLYTRITKCGRNSQKETRTLTNTIFRAPCVRSTYSCKTTYSGELCLLFNSIDTTIKAGYSCHIFPDCLYAKWIKSFLETLQGEETNVRENLTRDDSSSFVVCHVIPYGGTIVPWNKALC